MHCKSYLPNMFSRTSGGNLFQSVEEAIIPSLHDILLRDQSYCAFALDAREYNIQ